MKSFLAVHQSSDLYGSDKTLLILLEKLDRQKFYPVVILPSEGPLKSELEKIDVEVVIAPVLKIYRDMFKPGNLLRFFTEARKGLKILKALHKKHNFQFIYSNTLAVLLGMIFARLKGIRHIWHVHEIIVHPAIIANTFPLLLEKFADTVICNSYAAQKNLTDRRPALAAKSIVVHNGLEEITLDNRIDARNRFGYAENDIVITLLGRIGRFKGHKWLLTTYIKNNLKQNGIKLLFVGSTVPGQEFYLQELEELIKANALEQSVTILSFTKELGTIWAATDVAAVPSTEPEPFGLVAVEAMLAKKPVIAANHGGLTEIVVNDETGIFVEPGDYNALAEALATLATDEAMRAKLGTAGYERAKSEFSVSQYIAKISNVFERYTL